MKLNALKLTLMCLVTAVLFSFSPISALAQSTCNESQTFDSCTGTPTACTTYSSQPTCQAALGCGWTSGNTTSLKLNETFNSNSDWAVWSSSYNGIFYNTGDSTNCINEPGISNDDCFGASGGFTNSNLTKQSNIDLSTCMDGTAKLKIAKVVETGNLESDDCLHLYFSSNGGADYESHTNIFCDDNPASTFNTILPDTYLTSTMRLIIGKQGFTGGGEGAYLDGISITCAIDTSVCNGTANSCQTYSNVSSCSSASGCGVVCRQKTFCGDNLTQNPNEYGQSEACDAGFDNGVTCIPGYGQTCTYCSNTCSILNVTGEYCGDDIKSGPEECDGEAGIGAHQACTQSCQLINLTYCGDGIIQQPNDEGLDGPNDDGNEACDGTDGVGLHQYCDDVCILHDLTYCGDNSVQPTNDYNETEQCDDGVDNGQSCTPSYGGFCTYCSNSCLTINVTGPYCGDNTLNGDEQCDDGNSDNGDACLNTCVSNVCGDGILQDGVEFCDDGNNQSGDGCTSACTIEFCGDYTVNNNGTEQCDNGLGNTNTCAPAYGGSCQVCSTSCTNLTFTGEFCGDNVINGPEECDGSAPDHYLCENNCTLTYVPYCGDNTVDDGEACDGSAPEHYVCEDNCTLTYVPYCGDGNIDAGETCDTTAPEHYLCENNCTLTYVPYCGDNTVDNGEECDLGLSNGNACIAGYADTCSYCSDTCENVTVIGPYCGDSSENGNETCDDGNTDNGDGCNSACQAEFCSDGIVNNGEACDDGNLNDGDGCDESCAIEYCGDGVTNNVNETCDDSNTDSGDGCNSACQIEFCGDTIVNNDDTEQCDDGNNVSGDGCDDVCHLEECGDNVINNVNETCDDGNGDNGDGCNAFCQAEFCGDSLINNNNETCDNGASNGNVCSPAYGGSCQVCSTSCTNLTFTGEFCGDNVINGPEECDGSAPDHYLCENNCTLTYVPYCGDNTVDDGETCDGSAGVGEHQTCSQSCDLQNLTYCGDGVTQSPNDESLEEQCDDGNNDNGDGCDRACLIENPEEICGDGILTENEACDDGNNESGDGCSATCESEEAVPEFSGLAAGTALIGAGFAFAMLRRRK